MTHVEQGELQAYLDGEVTASSRASIETHLRGCSVCAAELAALRSASALFDRLIRHSDTEAPIAKARAAVTAARTDAARRRFALSRSALAKAAIFTIAFAALASAAIPGTPLHKWLSSALKREPVTATRSAPGPAAPTAAPAPTTVAPAASGEATALSIQPSEGRVRVILSDVSPTASVRVRLVDTDRAVVQVTGGAAHGRFRTGPGRIELVGVPDGVVTIDLPRNLKDMRVEVDGKVLFQTGQ
jgi:hypothetical protein